MSVSSASDPNDPTGGLNGGPLGQSLPSESFGYLPSSGW
jgi:hypothetical protein